MRTELSDVIEGPSSTSVDAPKDLEYDYKGQPLETFVEELSEKVHQAYCKEYERQHGEPYWTKGDYNLLDEDIKEYDRVTVRTILNHIPAGMM